jgi:hypothetical protein
MGTLNVDAINDAAGSITALDVTKEIGIWQFVSTAAVTAVGNLSITGMAVGYDYLIQLSGIAPTTDANSLFVRFGTGAGPTYLSGSADYGWGLSAQGGNGADASDSEIEISAGASTWGNDSNLTSTVEVTVVDPGNSSERTTCHFHGFVRDSSANVHHYDVNGGGSYIGATTAVTAIQFGWQTNYGTNTFKAQGDITVWRRRRS